jgi:hypothetical protein
VDLKYQKIACLTSDFPRCPIYQSSQEWRGAMPQALTPPVAPPPVTEQAVVAPGPPAPVAITPDPGQEAEPAAPPNLPIEEFEPEPIPEAEPEIAEPQPVFEAEPEPALEGALYPDFEEEPADEPAPVPDPLINQVSADQVVETGASYSEAEPSEAFAADFDPDYDESADEAIGAAEVYSEAEASESFVAVSDLDYDEPDELLELEPDEPVTAPKPAAASRRRSPLPAILVVLLLIGLLIGAGALLASGVLPIGAQPDPTDDAIVPSLDRTVVIPTAVINTPTTQPVASTDIQVTTEETPTDASTDPPTEAATAGPSPTSRATSEPIQMQLRYDTNLRAGPGTEFDVVRVVEAGIRILVIGRDQLGVWVAIRLLDGTEGWVAASQLTGDGNILDAPVITALPPSPTPEG